MNKRMKSLIIITLIVVVACFLAQNKMNNDVGMRVQYYNANRQPIGNTLFFSIIGGEKKAFVSISTTVKNTDVIPMIFYLDDVGADDPTQYKLAMPLRNETVSLVPQDSHVWNSQLINLTPFEGTTQNWEVVVAVEYNYYNQTIHASTHYKVTKTAGISFSVAPELPSVKFRTLDLAYAGNGAVAFGVTCDGITSLTKYGYSGATGILTGLCGDKMPTSADCTGGSVLLIAGLPGGWRSGGSSASLWQSSGDSTMVCVCDDDGSKYTIKKYKTSDSDASKVDGSPVQVDVALEVACQ